MKTIFKETNGNILYETDSGELFYAAVLIRNTLVRLKKGHFRVIDRIVDLTDNSVTYVMKKEKSEKS